MRQSLPRIPVSMGGILNLGKDCDDMEPGQLGSRLLPNFKIGTLLREELHVLEISGREPLHLRECRPEIG